MQHIYVDVTLVTGEVITITINHQDDPPAELFQAFGTEDDQRVLQLFSPNGDRA